MLTWYIIARNEREAWLKGWKIIRNCNVADELNRYRPTFRLQGGNGMYITIYQLDGDYKDCVLEMGGKIQEYNVTKDIDVEFDTSNGIGFVQMGTDVIGFTSPTVGMTLGRTEYLSIKIE